MILDVKDVTFSYNSHPVLKDIHFKVDKGEILAILGPNGVGKTTLLKCINAILRPGGGSILLDGQNVLSMDLARIARRIGYVAQRTEAAKLTVFDAILMGRRPHIAWKASRRDLAMVDAAIKRLNLERVSLRTIDRLSGGELQKVAIARALVQEPELLLLDEPTSSLDLKNQIETMNLIKRLVREHHVAAILTMHDLNMALRYTDKYLLLKEGEIFAFGHVADLTAETVQAVYGLPVEIHYHKGCPVVLPIEADEPDIL